MPERRATDRPDCAHRSCRCAADPAAPAPSRRRRRPEPVERVAGDDWAPWVAAAAANA